MVKVTGGELLSGDRKADVELSKVSTDSRTIKRGDFFIALTGPNYRGSLFVKDAFGKGAAGAIVDGRDVRAAGYNKILIKVRDTGKALADIARANRIKFRVPVVCVTGSNGKTTVKEMIAALLSEKYVVLKNEGTKNNQIGVPLTLLKLDKTHQVCVLELGTNHKGEIKALAGIALPTAAVITNIGPSHLENFSDLDGVYLEKKSILDSLGKGSFAVVNGDDPYLSSIKAKKFRLIKYGFTPANDIRGSSIHAGHRRIMFRVNDGLDAAIGLLGNHNVHNALAAIAVAKEFGVAATQIKRALLKLKPGPMRLNPTALNGISIINDSYNSNPASMKAALEAVVDHTAGAKWIVSGDMLELGDASSGLHRMVGSLVAGSTASGLITFGMMSKHTLSAALESGMNKDTLWHCASHDEIARVLKKVARSGDLVLIKGSRGMKMEKVIERLKG